MFCYVPLKWNALTCRQHHLSSQCVFQLQHLVLKMVSKSILLAVAAASRAFAQGAAYAQCGGQGYTGSTTCVSGYTCTYSSQYYSQCLPGSGKSHQGRMTSVSRLIIESGSAASTVKTTAKSTTPVAASTKAATTAAAASTKVSSTSTAGAAATGVTYKASFTEYGAGDTFGSPNCNTNTAACGFYTNPGFSAAVSQNEFGAGPGQGAGSACGTCWRFVRCSRSYISS